MPLVQTYNFTYKHPYIYFQINSCIINMAVFIRFWLVISVFSSQSKPLSLNENTAKTHYITRSVIGKWILAKKWLCAEDRTSGNITR